MPRRTRWWGLLGGLVLAFGAGMAGAQSRASIPAWGHAVPASHTAAPAPVGRLVIHYRSGVPVDRMVRTDLSGERRLAAAAVGQTTQRTARSDLRYLKSVAPDRHVVVLDQPVAPDDVPALLASLRADPDVVSVQVDVRVQRHALPTDPYFTGALAPLQWHLQASAGEPGGVNAAGAWERSTGTGVVVAVLDGGYRPHADLAANILTGYDFVSEAWTANDGELAGPGDERDANAEDPGDWVSGGDPLKPSDCAEEDSSWHGTHVAGLVGALANGVQGVGVAHGARILPVRVLGRCGGFLSDIEAGARWAAGLVVPGVSPSPTTARVLSLSLGSATACDSDTQQWVNEVRARNVSIVASTGNDSLSSITMPASCSGVVAVTAHNRQGRLASYANVGTGVSISAPGGELSDAVVSTWNQGLTVPAGDAYVGMHGTSMAVPQVSGVLALMAAARPDLPMGTLETLLRDSARAFPAGSYCARYPGQCGSGLLDAEAAVLAAESGKVVPVDAGSGGGCTVAPPGQADAGLPLLALLAALALLWRRRGAR